VRRAGGFGKLQQVAARKALAVLRKARLQATVWQMEEFLPRQALLRFLLRSSEAPAFVSVT